MAQRGGDLDSGKKAAKPAKKERAEKKPKPSSPTPNKMTFKDKHALETLPGRMADLQAEIDTHQATLADPD